MAHPCIGRHHHAGSGHLAPPRKVEILSHRHDGGVEALQLTPQVGPDEDAAAGCHEDVAHRIVLAVVHLAVLDAIHDRSGLVAVFAHVEQDRRVEPVDVLGRHDTGIGAE